MFRGILYKAVRRIHYRFIKNFNAVDSNIKSTLPKSVKLFGVTLKGNVRLSEGVKLWEGVYINGKVSIGRYTSINGPNTDIYSKLNSVEIGSFCSIARGVSIQEYNHKIDRISTYFMDTNIFQEESIDMNITSKGKIEIKNDVWIGAQSIILSGATIDNGAIVAANSVVTGYVPPYAIVAGSPAKIISYRFDPDVISLLNELQWWNWSIDKIKSNKMLFQSKLDISMLKNLIGSRNTL